MLELAEKGLMDRGRGEERFLAPLFPRAETLTSPGRQMVEALERGAPMQALVQEYAAL